MPISVTCGSCSTKLKAPESAAGRKVKCPKCGTLAPVPVETAAAPVAAVAKSANRGTPSVKAKPANPIAEPIPESESASSPEPELLEQFAMTKSIKDKARAHLEASESVLWVGKPTPKLILVRSLVVLVGGFVAAVALAIILRGNLALALLAFVVLMGIAVGTPLLRLWRATRTLYVLTGRRATVWEPNRFGILTVRDYTPDVLSKMFRRNSWFIKGAGDLVFHKKTVITQTTYVKRNTGPYHASHRGGTTRSTMTTYYWGFMAIDDVAYVEQIINDQVIAPYRNRGNT